MGKEVKKKWKRMSRRKFSVLGVGQSENPTKKALAGEPGSAFKDTVARSVARCLCQKLRKRKG